MDATAIRAGLDHPVIDADGHIIEYLPARPRLPRRRRRREPSPTRFDRRVELGGRRPRGLDVDTRRGAAASRAPGGGACRRATRSTAPPRCCPRLLYERLDELGIDVAVLYPTVGLIVMALDDDELRRAARPGAATATTPRCTADYRDRLLPVAVIPTYTPDEAIAELDHAVGELGLQGRPVRRAGAAARARARRRPRRPLGRRPRPRQRVRLRPGVAALRRARRLPDVPLDRHRVREPHVADQLRRQPHRELRGRRARPCAARCSSAGR